MPKRVVFYPYFHFRNANRAVLSKEGPAVTESDRTYRMHQILSDFSGDKLCNLEKALFPGRDDEYGFWTAEHSGDFLIGLGASSLAKFMERDGEIKVSYVVEKGTDILFIARILKDSCKYKEACIDIYMCPADGDYSKMLQGVSATLTEAGLTAEGLKPEPAEYTAVKYAYSNANGTKFRSGKHIFLPEQDKKPFKEQVAGCTWHTVILNNDVVNDGPRFVLLKNSGMKLGNMLDDLSHWMVHRRGGFVTGKEFTEGDFHQDTTYIIKEIDEYIFGEDIILNIECDTYSKNFDQGFEDFLKNLSETRFNK